MTDFHSEFSTHHSSFAKGARYTGNIAQASKSGQRSRHQSRQMARFPSSKRGKITNRDKNRDTLSRFGVMQAPYRLIATFVPESEIDNMFPKSTSETYFKIFMGKDLDYKNTH